MRTPSLPTTSAAPPLPTDTITLAGAPTWFSDACEHAVESRRVEAGGCPIHYLYWAANEAVDTEAAGLLFLHGGGAHANWWRFIAPFFTGEYRAAAMDLSGMGDSGSRSSYSATIRAQEIDAVMEHADFFEPGRPAPIIIGHSFGGLTAMRYASLHGNRIGGVVMAEAPVRPPNVERPASLPAVNTPEMKIYDSYATALSRFSLRPRQTCRHDYVVEHIARHSIRRVDAGWSWKFDPGALTSERHAEPFRDYLAGISCRTALVYGDKSAITTPQINDYMLDILGPDTPIVGVPEGQHHLFLDEPLAFVSAVRAILEGWRVF
ncbi:MAG: alpha/beta hydrolase [Chromatiales bacterium]|jgi:pimeloyl-ACP methyl ester carboxylesterase|nr:alpha/beta hydrolase [Chromatiales bacterium]